MGSNTDPQVRHDWKTRVFIFFYFPPKIPNAGDHLQQIREIIVRSFRRPQKGKMPLLGATQQSRRADL